MEEPQPPPPPSKRRKGGGPSSSSSTLDDVNPTTISRGGTLIGKVKDTCYELSNISSKDDIVHAKGRILQLKAMQCRLFDRIQRSESVLAQQTIQRNEQSIRLDNLKSQQIVNMSTVEQCHIPNNNNTIVDENDNSDDKKWNSTLPEIVNLVKGASPSPSEDNGNDNTDAKSTFQMISQFLEGVNICDPEQRNVIADKLNSELTARKELEGTLKEKQDQLKSLQSILSSKHKFLRDLPNRLDEIEKASLPLQKLCQREASSSGNNSGGGGKSATGQLQPTTSFIGSERRQRFELAQTLPKSLYSLFYQIQSSLDTLKVESTTNYDVDNGCLPTIDIMTNKASSSSLSSSKTVSFTASTKTAAGADQSTGSPQVSESTAEPSSSSVVVVLKVPIPDVSNSGIVTYKGKKFVTITFRYDTVVGVILTNCSTGNGMEYLIHELFPGDNGDDGRRSATNPTALIQQQQSQQPEYFVYQWANYLAGLHFPTSELTSSKMRQSATVILKAIIRRVRAVATLNRVTSNLLWNLTHFTIHPNLKTQFEDLYNGFGGGMTKLSSWTKGGGDESSSSSRHSVYVATIEHGTGKLMLNVTIDIARYPSVPPHWTLVEPKNQHEQTSLGDNTTTLYDGTIDKLLRRVNNGVADLVLPNQEDTYDWIIVQQLASLIQGWNSALS